MDGIYKESTVWKDTVQASVGSQIGAGVGDSGGSFSIDGNGRMTWTSDHQTSINNHRANYERINQEAYNEAGGGGGSFNENTFNELRHEKLQEYDPATGGTGAISSPINNAASDVSNFVSDVGNIGTLREYSNRDIDGDSAKAMEMNAKNHPGK